MVNRTRCFVIAEAGVNHNGSLDLALELVAAAATAGADAVKFQTFSADALVGAGVAKADYQKSNTGAGDQHSMLKALELGREHHEILARRCTELGIEFMSTPFDESALDFLVALGIKRVKMASGELTNKPFLERAARTGLPLIVSTGMGASAEIREALAWIAAAGNPPVSLLHCTSNYPAAFEDVNLTAMQSMARDIGVPVGYSDHTSGITIAPVAVGLGATIIEKHFTMDRKLPGPDHAASLEVHELVAMVRAIRDVEAALGDGIKAPRAVELPVRDLVRRSVSARRDLAAGAVLTREDLVLLRPATGIAPKELEGTIGRKLGKAVAAGSVIKASDLA
jgi:N,N'-diacetyllegionaminate synthase